MVRIKIWRILFFFWGSNVQQLNLGWMDEYGLSGTLAQIQNANKWTATTKYILYREARKLKREKQFEFNSKWQPQSWFVICYCPSDLSFFLTKFITSPFIFLFYQPKSLLIYLFIYFIATTGWEDEVAFGFGRQA